MDTINIDVEKLNINKNTFIKHIYDNALHNIKSEIKSNYQKNKNNLNNEEKNNVKSLFNVLKGGKIYDKQFDTYTYFLLNIYDVVDSNMKKTISDHIQNKLVINQNAGGTLEDFKRVLDTLKEQLKRNPSSEKDQEDTLDLIRQLLLQQQQIMNESGSINGIIDTGIIRKNIFEIKNNLGKLEDKEIFDLTDQQTIDNLTVHLTDIGNLKTHNGNDIKSIIGVLKTHVIMAASTLKKVVSDISQAGSNSIIYTKINQELDIQSINMQKIIEKIVLVTNSIDKATSELKLEEEFNIYPLDVKIVSNDLLNKLFNGKPEYYIKQESTKITFKTMPTTVDEIIKKMKERKIKLNKKIPGVASNIITSINSITNFQTLIDNLKTNHLKLFFGDHSGGAGGTDDIFANNFPIDTIIGIDAQSTLNAEFSSMTSIRKQTSVKIKFISSLILEMNDKTNKLISSIEDFNLNESREHYFAYVMANLAVNANTSKKYKYISFGVLDFYKSIIDTIYNKINYERDGEIYLNKDGNTKYLFFYHFHYKIIKKLKIFLDKFYKLKDLNIFYLKNTFIEISECTGKVKEYLSLLNIFKYILDDFYSKIGLGKSIGSVGIYLRINDFPNEKLLLGRQFGIVNQNSTITDPSRDQGKGAFMYNVDLVENLLNIADVDSRFQDGKKNEIKNAKKVNDKLDVIFDIINTKDLKNKWQQSAGVMPNEADNYGKKLYDDNAIDKDLIKQKWSSVGNYDDTTTIIDDNLEKIKRKYDNVGNLIEEVLYKPESKTIAELMNERELKRFYLVNRKVRTINEDDYVKESLDDTKPAKINFNNIGKLRGDYNDELASLNDKSRSLISKIAFIPILSELTDASLKSLDLFGFKQSFTENVSNNTTETNNSLFKDKKLTFKLTINDEEYELDFTDDDKRLKLYKEFFNNAKIYIPLLIGFFSYEVEIKDKYDKDTSIFKNYSDLFKSLGITSFKFTNEVTTLKIKDNKYDENESLEIYHHILKKNFKTLFFEQTNEYRDESELIFNVSADSKQLIIDNTSKCKRLLDRFSNEDDYNLIDSIKGIDKTSFNHVFSNEKCPDNESIAMFMSIPSKLSLGNGFMLLTFGYSGTGKTYTVFGENKPGKSPTRGILQTTLNDIDKEDGSPIYFRCYEVYGIGLPYASYWYDKLGTNYDPKRIDLLIHHQFKDDGGVLKTEKLHIFDDPKLKKNYLNNVNWFFPDAGKGDYTGDELNIDETTAPLLNESTYVCDVNELNPTTNSIVLDKEKIGYVKYDNQNLDKKYLMPRLYTEFKDEKIGERKIITTPNATNVAFKATAEKFDEQHIKLNSTYTVLTDDYINKFGSIIENIDTNRKATLLSGDIKYNNDKTIPSNYKHIRRIKQTANNPESSRSVIFYEFVVKLKEPQLVPIIDENGRTVNVWRYYVTLLIVDLPGQEDIKTSFVEKEKYDIKGTTTNKHQPIFKKENVNTYMNTVDTAPVFFTYKEDEDIQDTNNNAEVYKYNQLLQKMIKSSVYMNPLFKFMSKLTFENSTKFDFENPTGDINNNVLLGNSWNKVTNDDNLITFYDIRNISNTNILSHSDYIDFLKNIPRESKGSELFKNNLQYIMHGLYLLQTNPMDYIITYLLDDITTKADANEDPKDDALAPFEGYMINENVGSLITYLFNKINKPNNKRKILSIKEQQPNFGSYLSNGTIFTDMNTDVEINNQNTEGVKTRYGFNIIDSYNMKTGNLSLNLTTNDILAVKNVKLFEILKSYYLNTSDGVNINRDNVFDNDTIAYKVSKLKDELMIPDNSQLNEKIDKIYKYKDITYTPSLLTSVGYNGVQTFEQLDGDVGLDKKNIIESNPLFDKDVTPLRYASNDNPKYFNTIRDIINSSNKRFYGKLHLWKIFYNYYVRYIMLIDLFVIIKKLRGCDKYFRENTMAHMSDRITGRVANSKEDFEKRLEKLQKFYDYYMNTIITSKTNDPYTGIYDKKKLFRNGEDNKFLKDREVSFYQKKNESEDAYYVSDRPDLEEHMPDLDKLNKKPLIYNYLEPYEPFFNTYSLLYVMSNNDPHIKCYKQMELLQDNSLFITKVSEQNK